MVAMRRPPACQLFSPPGGVEARCTGLQLEAAPGLNMPRTCSIRSGTVTWSPAAGCACHAVYRPAPGARSHLPAGLQGLREKGLKVRRPERTVATMDHSIPTTRARSAHARRVWRRASSPACSTTARISASRLYDLDEPAARHRARYRSGAGAYPARHDHRVRRQPHLHPRRLRRAGLWHRHQRGGARAGDPVPAAVPPQDLPVEFRGPPAHRGVPPRI